MGSFVDGDISNIGVKLHLVIGEILRAFDNDITNVVVRIKVREAAIGNFGVSNGTVCLDGGNRTLLDLGITDTTVRNQFVGNNGINVDVADTGIKLNGRKRCTFWNGYGYFAGAVVDSVIAKAAMPDRLFDGQRTVFHFIFRCDIFGRLIVDRVILSACNQDIRYVYICPDVVKTFQLLDGCRINVFLCSVRARARRMERKVREEITQVVETTTNDADYSDNCNNRKIYAFFHESLLTPSKDYGSVSG